MDFIADVALVRWAASLATIVAAGLVAIRATTALTAFGFALFVVASVAWIVASLLDDRDPLLVQNVVLLGVNLFGLWRWGRASWQERRSMSAARGAGNQD